jgi:hypothetical protein
MAGFLDNIGKFNPNISRILKSISGLGSFGMEYKDMVIEDSMAIGISEANMRERFGFSGDDLSKIAVGDFLKFADTAKSYEVIAKSPVTTPYTVSLRVIGSTGDAYNALLGRTSATAVWAYSRFLNQTLSTATTTKL